MTFDLFFWFALLVKMAVAAGVVIGVTVVAERVNPLISGLIATLPLAAGPAYIFLAFDHDAQFIADSGLLSLAANPAIAIYGLVYVWLAQRHSLAVSAGCGMLVWIALAIIVQSVEWTTVTAIGFNAVVLPLCVWLGAPLRHRTIPRVPIYWYDVLVRALLVSCFVAAVVALSFTLGPRGTGILSAFPIIFTSIMVILHGRIGGPATAAVLANTFVGLIGFGSAMLTVHLAPVPLGTPVALVLSFVVALAWGLLVLGVRRLRAAYS